MSLKFCVRPIIPSFTKRVRKPTVGRGDGDDDSDSGDDGARAGRGRGVRGRAAGRGRAGRGRGISAGPGRRKMLPAKVLKISVNTGFLISNTLSWPLS
jgi:hypothetical protein